MRCLPSCTPEAVRCALVYGLCEMGWNKALDAAEHDDPAMRAREQADLDLWVARAGEALERGVV